MHTPQNPDTELHQAEITIQTEDALAFSAFTGLVAGGFAGFIFSPEDKRVGGSIGGGVTGMILSTGLTTLAMAL